MTDPVRTSKRLAYVLRHHPESVGVVLDPAGWIELDELLAALSEHGRTVTEQDVHEVLDGIPKQRFELRDERIRATHGHSVEVDLGLTATEPPPTLFHGTVERFLEAIWEQGLRSRGRRAVHLSEDPATAQEVGRRRGSPVVLTVDAASMHRQGHTFRRATDGIWLTDHVPPTHLERLHG